jgi:hypothetical protein
LQFFLVFASKQPHNRAMTTAIRLRRLSGWSIRCVAVVFLLALGASAVADTGRDAVSPVSQQPAQKRAKKACYTMTTASGIPMPCSRLAAIPTTASPMNIYGHKLPKE